MGFERVATQVNLVQGVFDRKYQRMFRYGLYLVDHLQNPDSLLDLMKVRRGDIAQMILAEHDPEPWTAGRDEPGVVAIACMLTWLRI